MKLKNKKSQNLNYFRQQLHFGFYDNKDYDWLSFYDFDDFL